MSRNWCEFFKLVEQDPFALVTDFTIRDYYEARQHVNICVPCQESADRVLAKHKKDDGNTIGFNIN